MFHCGWPPTPGDWSRWSGESRADDGQPPITRFLAEQLGTAHWFDQRRTREALGWTPRVSLDEGFELLARGLAARQILTAIGVRRSETQCLPPSPVGH